MHISTPYYEYYIDSSRVSLLLVSHGSDRTNGLKDNHIHTYIYMHTCIVEWNNSKEYNLIESIRKEGQSVHINQIKIRKIWIIWTCIFIQSLKMIIWKVHS